MPSLLESGREMCSGHLISRRRLCLRWDIVVLSPEPGFCQRVWKFVAGILLSFGGEHYTCTSVTIVLSFLSSVLWYLCDALLPSVQSVIASQRMAC